MAVAPPDPASAESPRFESIEALFAALESPLLSYALRLVPARAAAEDIVQEAFMKLHTHFDTVREPRRWLYRTVHNLALNVRRKEDRIVPLTPALPPNAAHPHGNAGSPSAHNAAAEAFAQNATPDPDLLPDEQIVRWEGIGLVRLSLDTLDPRSREIVRLKFEEDLSYREISSRIGVSPGNVGFILHHALKSLAAELSRAGLIP